MDKKKTNNYGQLATQLLNAISDVYWGEMYRYIEKNDIDFCHLNCFILNPESIVIYFAQNFIALEYCGNPYVKNVKEQTQWQVTIRDFTKENISAKQFFEKIVGFSYDSTSGISMPLYSNIYEDLIIPTNAGMHKLMDLQWNFSAQNSILSFNSSGLELVEGNFIRLINCSFFDAQKGDLNTRIIKWIDFIPCQYIELPTGDVDQIYFNVSIYKNLWKHDLFYQYPEPMDYKYSKLPQINRFIEMFGNSQNSEPEITTFLSKPENQFILSMGFMGLHIHPQYKCEWQSEDKKAIIPDFFVVRANGYADIVEFKLPNIRGKAVVGKDNRKQFNAQINSYIAQTRVYEQYFEDPNNRRWVERNFGFKVYKPKRYLVIGRRTDFDCDEWIEIKSDYTNLEIVTYDDLVDTVVSQFYR